MVREKIKSADQLSGPQRVARIAATRLVRQSVEVRDPSVTLPLIAMTRRIYEVCLNIRHMMPVDEDSQHSAHRETILQTLPCTRLDWYAQKLFEKVGIGEPQEAEYEKDSVRLSATTYQLPGPQGLFVDRIAEADKETVEYVLHDLRDIPDF